MSKRTISTKYRKTIGKEELQIEVYYSLGGWNNFNAINEPRGYWLSISPIERDEQTHMIAFTLGRGRKKFLTKPAWIAKVAKPSRKQFGCSSP